MLLFFFMLQPGRVATLIEDKEVITVIYYQNNIFGTINCKIVLKGTEITCN